MNTCRNRGLTLIETLVVIVLIGVLCALLIPAVSALRNTSSRLSCQNNLRQLGMALSNYHSSFDSFPPAQAISGFSAFTLLMPYYEKGDLYNSLNFSLGPYNGIPEIASKPIMLSILICPSDSHPQEGLAWTNYAANRGSGTQKFGENGAFRFPPGETLSTKDFQDGLGNTVMVSEWLIGSDFAALSDPSRTVYQTKKKLPQAYQLDEFASECHKINTATAQNALIKKGMNFFHGELGMTLYNHVLGPNDHSCLNGSGYQIGAWTVGSSHSGGVNALFGDGSCRFIKDSINLQAWRSFGSRNGGEVQDTTF